MWVERLRRATYLVVEPGNQPLPDALEEWLPRAAQRLGRVDVVLVSPKQIDQLEAGPPFAADGGTFRRAEWNGVEVLSWDRRTIGSYVWFGRYEVE